MKRLLLDQNISYRLVKDLQDSIPELTHVKFEGLLDSEDNEIWNYAKTNNLTIITFDADFYEIQTVKGFPPKIIWLRFGNLTRGEFILFFQNNIDKIKDFLTSNEYDDMGCLEFKEY